MATVELTNVGGLQGGVTQGSDSQAAKAASHEAEGKSPLFPTYARFPITLVKGEGSRLWDDQGKEYLDFMSGIAVANLGHVPQEVKSRLVEQLDQLWHVSNLFEIPSQTQLAQLLVDFSCADAVFFANSGAEANEGAIKLARKYQQKVLGNGKYEIITFGQSFHGRTLATLTATGQDKVKEGFTPLPEGFIYATFNDLDSVKQAITERTGAIMLELIQAEGGVFAAKQEFVDGLAQLCKEHGLLLIVDEIQTGMGRTGKLFAYEHYGVEPDIFTLAKGLGSGFPVGAVLGKAHLAEAFSAGSHGSTFGGNPLATTAGLATLEVMLRDGVAEHAAELGRKALDQLKKGLESNPFVKEVRGQGLLIGIECADVVAGIIQELQNQGLLVITAGPNVIRLLPNLRISEEDLQHGVAKIISVLDLQK